MKLLQYFYSYNLLLIIFLYFKNVFFNSKEYPDKVWYNFQKSTPNLPNFFKTLSSGGEEVEEEKRLGRLVEK